MEANEMYVLAKENPSKQDPSVTLMEFLMLKIRIAAMCGNFHLTDPFDGWRDLAKEDKDAALKCLIYAGFIIETRPLSVNHSRRELLTVSWCSEQFAPLPILDSNGKIPGVTFGVSKDGGRTAVAWRDSVFDAFAYLDLQNKNGNDYAVVAARTRK